MFESSGWIASPDFDLDGAYDFNIACEWFIQVSPGKVIQLEILYIYMPDPVECPAADQLSVSLALRNKYENLPISWDDDPDF